MYFNTARLQDLYAAFALVQPKYVFLIDQFTTRHYQQPRAREFAQHGFSRRLKTITRCIEQVFALIPPDADGEQSAEIRADTEICIQAFVSNVFGTIDNLAWIWTYERQVVQTNGQPPPRAWVGLRPDNAFLRATFSEDFQQFLATLGDWFAYLEDYRDALAHRIPLYIPPLVVTTNHPNGEFRPLIMHSFEEGADPFEFHSQMLTDFSIIDSLGRRILEELGP